VDEDISGRVSFCPMSNVGSMKGAKDEEVIGA